MVTESEEPSNNTVVEGYFMPDSDLSHGSTQLCQEGRVGSNLESVPTKLTLIGTVYSTDNDILKRLDLRFEFSPVWKGTLAMGAPLRKAHCKKRDFCCVVGPRSPVFLCELRP
jgi:hypothetical protein